MFSMTKSSSIQYISRKENVSMADQWFHIATMEHFWVRRRFDVFKKLLSGIDVSHMRVGEVGCGHGLVQAQFKGEYGVSVEGFELNEYALNNSVALDQPRIIYNIHERCNDLEAVFDALLLFDVIEHIDNDVQFMESALFHVKPGGLIVTNTPAIQSLFSAYDRVAGHKRRYSLADLARLGEQTSMRVEIATYWGITLSPLLLVRKACLLRYKNDDNIIKKGFKPPSGFANKLLYTLSQFEKIPQQLTGSSAMMLYRKV